VILGRGIAKAYKSELLDEKPLVWVWFKVDHGATRWKQRHFEQK
jgi:hypothetical protein